MDSYGIFNGKQIAIQITNSEEDPSPEDILLLVKCWNPESWELSDTFEIYVSKNTTLANFGSLLSNLFGIPEKELECCKIGSAWSFSRVQLPSEQWVKTFENHCFISANPFFLSVDGCLLIVKKLGAKERDLNEEERKRYAAFDYERLGSYKHIPGKNHKIEKAMKITVYKNEESKGDKDCNEKKQSKEANEEIKESKDNKANIENTKEFKEKNDSKENK